LRPSFFGDQFLEKVSGLAVARVMGKRIMERKRKIRTSVRVLAMVI
jgi:hypothetical protein